MTIFGAIGIVSTLSFLIKLPEEIQLLVSAFQAVTHPFWDFSLGRALDLVKLDFPWWFKDYFTVGLIIGGAESRVYAMALKEGAADTYLFDMPPHKKARYYFKIVTKNLFIWPATLAFYARNFLSWHNGLPRWYVLPKKYYKVYFEFLAWTAVIIFFSYGIMIFRS